MRASRSATALLVATLLGVAPLGCFVGDELNKSTEIADHAVAARKRQADLAAGKDVEKPQEVAKAPAGDGKPAPPKGAAWWKTAVTLGSEESTADIVSCKLSRGVEFMERDDCLSRGGVPE
jgi:hypothetical protein